MLVIGRALMALPTMCIFDEPSIGMAPLLVDQSFHVISQLRDEGITVLLIEQNVNKSLEIADRGYVLQNGRVVLAGSREEARVERGNRARLSRSVSTDSTGFTRCEPGSNPHGRSTAQTRAPLAPHT